MTLDQARGEYEGFKRTHAFVNWKCADDLITALTADNDALAGELGRKNDRNRQLTASVEKLERERDAYRHRFMLLQTAASGAGERECQHDSISGGVCDNCCAYIKTVRLDDIGLVSDILDYQRLEQRAEQAEAALVAERERAEKWEWVAYHNGCGTCAGHESIGVRNALSRYAARPAPDEET